jgi:hypothetical protein
VRLNKKSIRVQLSEQGSETTVKLSEIREVVVGEPTVVPDEFRKSAERTENVVPECQIVDEHSDPKDKKIATLTHAPEVAFHVSDEMVTGIRKRRRTSVEAIVPASIQIESDEKEVVAAERKDEINSSAVVAAERKDEINSSAVRSASKSISSVGKHIRKSFAHTPVRKDARPSIMPRSTKTQRIREEAIAQKRQSILKVRECKHRSSFLVYGRCIA